MFSKFYLIIILGIFKFKNICFDVGEFIKYVYILFCFVMISIKKFVRILLIFGIKIDENFGIIFEG